MKTSVMLAVLVLAGLFGSSCATMSQLNAEYEEEVSRIEKMNPEEKQAWDEEQQRQERIRFYEESRAGDND